MLHDELRSTPNIIRAIKSTEIGWTRM